jgi:hypothetical protein
MSRNVQIVALIVVAAVGFYFFFRRGEANNRAQLPAPPASNASTNTATDPLSVQSEIKAPATGAATAIAKPPPSPNLSALRKASEQGRADAMRDLGLTLRGCMQYANLSDQQIDAKRSALEEKMAALRTVTANPADPSAFALEASEQWRKIRDDCEGVEPGEVASWESWLERAASNGDQEAIEQLGRTVAGPYPLADEPDTTLSEYTRRRKVAEDLLSKSVESGSCSDASLNTLQRLSSDAESAYVYGSILLQRGRQNIAANRLDPNVSPVTESQTIELSQRQLAASLTNANRTQAQSRLQALLSGPCRT